MPSQSEDMVGRERIAQELLRGGMVDGFAVCPGVARHTKQNGKRDFRVVLDAVPTGFCFHGSCAAEVEAFNHELRSRIWHLEHGTARRAMPSEWGHVAREPQAKTEKRCAYDIAALKAVVAAVPESCGEAWLAALSPVTVSHCRPETFLDALYQPRERVLIFTKFASQGQFMRVAHRGNCRLANRPGVKAVESELPNGGPDGVWFLCAPVTGKWAVPRHPTLDEHGRPKLSRRFEGVVTSFRFLVLESDEAPEGLWLRLLAKLPLPIAAIYTSGGRSIHALIKVDAPDKQWWDRYKLVVCALLSKLGADPAAMSAVRLTRLPGCTRGDRLQKLLYLNPNPDPSGVPLIEQAVPSSVEGGSL